MHHYFKLYFKSRIKATYVQRYGLAEKAYNEYVVTKDAYDEAVEDGDKTTEPVVVQKPVAVTLRAAVGKEFWLLETAEFWETIRLDAVVG